VLQRLELVLDRRRHPLDGVAEQVQQQEALHLEPDVRIDRRCEAVEDAGPRRLEIAVLDGETVLDDAAAHRRPDVDQLVCRHVADAGADDFVAGERLHARDQWCTPGASWPVRATYSS
jgi:hypothetical protein